jgi:hypothetical protein
MSAKRTKQAANENIRDDRDDSSLAAARPQSADHVSASGDDETIDGLNESDEAVRQGAEDVPAKRQRRLPVFERGEEAPKLD